MPLCEQTLTKRTAHRTEYLSVSRLSLSAAGYASQIVRSVTVT